PLDVGVEPRLFEAARRPVLPGDEFRQDAGGERLVDAHVFRADRDGLIGVGIEPVHCLAPYRDEFADHFRMLFCEFRSRHAKGEDYRWHDVSSAKYLLERVAVLAEYRLDDGRRVDRARLQR